MNFEKLVAIAGSQGSGKSTLIDAICDKYGDRVGVVTRKTSRSVLEEWNMSLDEINDNVDLSQKFQAEILLRKIDDDIELMGAGKDIIITERTPVDFFVYTLVNIGKFNEHDEWVSSYYDDCARACAIYDHVIHLPAGKFSTVNDGVRSINPHFVNMIHLTQRHYYDDLFEGRFHDMHSVDIDQRVMEFAQAVGLEDK